ncbi:hypothetical protein, partial [Streptomyces sp. NPDC088551]|uniref:hypothetical protein n=1 Tax=Streptomyces sp. NPDC088551 TaxID=3365863 RepID=UPI00383BC5BB
RRRQDESVMKILSPTPFPKRGRICIMRGPPDSSIDRRDARKAAVSKRIDGSKTCCTMRGPQAVQRLRERAKTAVFDEC